MSSSSHDFSFGSSSKIGKQTLFLLILLGAIHFGFGFLLNLSVDEAHYALYGLHLDWSYFDHPPMVGWIQAIPVKLDAGDGILRLIPETLWLLTIALSMKITAQLLQLFGRNEDYELIKSSRYWTAITLMLAPILHVLAVGLLPDTLLISLTSALIYTTLKIHESLRYRNRDLSLWILLGVLLGLSGLSKYTALFSALAVPICLFTWHGKRLLGRPGLWICLLISALLITPVIYWNYNNDWISFIYQIKHGAGGEWKLRRVGVFLLNQLVSYGPLMLLGFWYAKKHRIFSSSIILSFFLLPFLVFSIMSGGGGSLPHWTSPAWIALAPISGAGLAYGWRNRKASTIKILSGLQFLICGVGFTLLFCGGLPWVTVDDPLGSKNPIADLYGWKDAGQEAQELSRNLQIPHLAVQNWTLGSRLAWYARPLPTYILENRFDQFTLWFGELPKGSDAIVVNWSQMSFFPPTHPGGFSSCETIATQDVVRLGRTISSFEFFACRDWGGVNSPTRQEP